MKVQPDQMVAVKSSQIANIGHDAESKTLAVQFTNGMLYEYGNVPVELHARLMGAESVGKFFSAEIKKYPAVYPFTQVVK